MLQVADSDSTIQLLIFEIGDRRFAIPTTAVLEVLRAVAVTLLPDAPPIVLGVIDLRGAIVPVLDVRLRLGAAPRPLESSDRMIVIATAGGIFALRTDLASDIVHVRARDLDDARRALPHVAQIAGIARLADGLVVVHDIDAFLSQAEAATLERALAAAEAGP